MTPNQRKKMSKADLEAELKVAGIQTSDGRPLSGLLKPELLLLLEEFIGN